MELTHIDKNGAPKMVDVGDKDISKRIAVASGVIKMSFEAYEAVVSGSAKKGSVLHTAVVAAIMGAKKTSEIIPMCHNINLDGVNCEFEQIESLPGFKLTVSVRTAGTTGVEMEALSAVSIGLLTVYDMLKAIDKGMEILNIALEKKSGGKNGDFTREIKE